MPNSQACCAHSHDCEASDCSTSFSLFKHINLSSLRCLNCLDTSPLQHVFRTWDERLTELSPPLRSNEEDEDDERELLIHVEFDGAVKLSAVTLIGGRDESTSPSKLRVFVNRDDLDFEAIRSLPPTQAWELQPDPSGVLEYPSQAHKFQGVTSIDLHVQGTFGADFISIDFIGFKGTFTERKRQAVEAVYEARAMPSDHKVSDVQGASYGL